MNEAGQLVIFEAENGPVQVRLEGETVWLTQAQMAELFGTSSDNISLHLKNIYKEQELQEAATTEDFSVVRQEGARQVRRRLKHYNLDAIISVGYRVSSAKATRFRQWATTVLREHLTRGFTLNHQRFERNAAELEAALQLVRRAAAGEALTAEQGRGLVDVIARYTQTFLWLQRYDEGLLTAPAGSPGGAGEPRRGGAVRAVRGRRCPPESWGTAGAAARRDPQDHAVRTALITRRKPPSPPVDDRRRGRRILRVSSQTKQSEKTSAPPTGEVS